MTAETVRLEPAARTPAWWGMVLFIATEAALFGLLLASYFFIRFTTAGPWPQGGIEPPSLTRPIVMTALLVVAGCAAQLAARRTRAGWLVALALLGSAFVALQAWEYVDSLDLFRPRENAYGSLFYTITGVHGVHVAFGVLFAAWLLVTWRRREPGAARAHAGIAAAYWAFLAVTWLFVFASLYLAVRV